MIKRSLAVAHVNHEFVPEYIRLHNEIPAALLEEYGLTKENIIAKVEAFAK